MVRAANYGHRLKVGLMLPSPNAVAEQQMAAMLPDGASFQTTRLKLAGGTREELFAMTEEVERAAELLTHARVALLAFHCTAASTLEPGLIDDIKERIERVSGARATTTGPRRARCAAGARRQEDRLRLPEPSRNPRARSGFLPPQRLRRGARPMS